MHTHGMGNKMQEVTSSQVARWAASSAWSTQRKQHFPILISIARLCITRLRLHSILFLQNKKSDQTNSTISAEIANFFCPGLQLHYLCGRRLCRRFDTFRGGWWLFCRHTSGDSLQRQSRSLHVVNGVMQQVQLIQFNGNTNAPMPYCIANSTKASNISFFDKMFIIKYI